MSGSFEFFIIILLAVFCSLAFADPSAYTFQEWKQQQILEAQNQMLRISAKINQLKATKPGKSESKDAGWANIPNRRVKKTTQTDPVASAEIDLKNAQECLEAANELQFDDYISIYLPTLSDQPDQVNKLAEKLSKDDLAEIFKGLVKRGIRPTDAPHASASPGFDGLTASSRIKSQ